jgi:hypothetical protein
MSYRTLDEALAAYPDAYVSMAMIGNCKVCGTRQDLRCGACFDCSDKVAGEPIQGGHRLWEKAKPQNFWFTPDA